jgi:hypothetical protein
VWRLGGASGRGVGRLGEVGAGEEDRRRMERQEEVAKAWVVAKEGTKKGSNTEGCKG